MTHRPPPALRTALLLATTTLVLAGCSGNPLADVTADVTADETTASAAPPASETVAATPPPTAAATTTDPGSEPTPTDTAEDPTATTSPTPPTDAPSAEPAAPVATIPGSGPFSEVVILDFRRTGNLVSLEFAMTTSSDDLTPAQTRITDVYAAPPEAFQGDNSGPNSQNRLSISGTTLVDGVNNTRHLVARDAEGQPLATRFPDYNVEPDTTYAHSLQFAAPPPDVEVMTVSIPQHQSVEVPLRDGGEG